MFTVVNTLRDRVRALRKSGESLKSIARLTSTSLSTVSYWCRDIILSTHQKRHLATAAVQLQAEGRARAVARNRQLYEARCMEDAAAGMRLLENFSDLPFLMLGLGLYLGDGFKTGSGCGFANANVALVRLMMSWFECCFGIGRERFSCRVIIHESYRGEVDTIRKEWCDSLNLPLQCFTGFSFVRSKIDVASYPDRGSYKGTLAFKVRRSSRVLRQILGMADALVYKGGTRRPG